MSLDQIKKARGKLAKRFHPDRSGDPDTLETSKLVNLAYDTIKNDLDAAGRMR